jgi:uncharacterized membrane protein
LTIHVVLYTHAQDPSGEEAKRWLDDLRATYPHSLEIREAPGDYSPPSIAIDNRPIKVPFSQADLKSALAIAGAVAVYKEDTRIPAPILKLSQAADAFAAWFGRHWLASFNTIVFVYLAIAFFPPILIKLGATTPASWLYTIYGFACHQLGFRSFFLFGQQFAYPRDIFQQITGVDPNDLLASRAFVGNTLLGFKVALCERDVAIYGSIVLAGIGFHFVKHKVKPLSLLGWFLLGILPIGLDGGTQLLSYLPWHIFPFRESTVFLRTLTGTMFGITCVWFAYPYVQESMDSDLGPLATPQKK